MCVHVYIIYIYIYTDWLMFPLPRYFALGPLSASFVSDYKMYITMNCSHTIVLWNVISSIPLYRLHSQALSYYYCIVSDENKQNMNWIAISFKLNHYFLERGVRRRFKNLMKQGSQSLVSSVAVPLLKVTLSSGKRGNFHESSASWEEV